jgi:plastocyanin
VKVAPVIGAVAGAALICAAPAAARPYSPAAAHAAGGRTVKLFDNYFQPSKLTVNRGTRITWKWPEFPIDVHDVKLKSGPAGVRKFHSEPASSGYRFRRRLKQPGRYKIVCTLHEDMTMKIRVRRS